MPEHPPSKFGVLIGVLSLSSSTEAGGVTVPETFRVGTLSVRPRDELDGKKELELLSFDKLESAPMSFWPPLFLFLRLLG